MGETQARWEMLHALLEPHDKKLSFNSMEMNGNHVESRGRGHVEISGMSVVEQSETSPSLAEAFWCLRLEG